MKITKMVIICRTKTNSHAKDCSIQDKLSSKVNREPHIGLYEKKYKNTVTVASQQLKQVIINRTFMLIVEPKC
jgi:hypothetical protein